MAAYDGRNALALCALAAQADLDAEHGDVSSATQPIGEAENDATMKQRRLTIFTRILICSVILMIMSLIMMALGLVDLFMLGDSGTIDQARAYIILSLFAMSFSTSIWPIFMFKEGRKTNGKFKDMSTMFNGCRVLTLIWSIFTLILVGGAIVMPIISVAKRFPDGDKAEKSVFFEIIVIFICLTIGTLIFLISCPICCCPTVFGYTKYESHSREYWYDRSRELEQLKQEVAARDQQEAYNRANMMNEQHSGVIPSAPVIDNTRRPERGYRDDRYFDDRGYQRGETRGRGRGRGRPPLRGERERQNREHDGRDSERYRDHRDRDGERDRYRDGERGRDYERDGERRRGHGRGRGRSRGRSRGRGRGGRPTDRPLENKEHEDEPPSYAEVLEQMGDNETNTDNGHTVDNEHTAGSGNTADNY